MGIIDKSSIEKWILPHLSIGTRGFKPEVPLVQIVQAIFHRVKTGTQWRELPVKQFFDKKIIKWGAVFHHFNEWSKDGSWKRVWIELLRSNYTCLDLSSVQIDGSHTVARGGGEAIGYQGRKANETTNSLFLADNTGQMLAISTPQEGQHHDLYNIQSLFNELCDVLKLAGIDVGGLFMNADSGFDSKEFRSVCAQNEIEANVKTNPRNTKKDEEEYQYFDDELYKKRIVIEQANAWIDSYKALLIRFEKTIINWMSLHWIAFSARFINKTKKQKKV